MGGVEGVKFTDDLSRVVVSVRVDTDVAQFIDADASFWIVRPQVSAQGVTRLDTVLSGAFIEGYWDAEVSEPAARFTGLDRPPLIRNDQPGTWVTLSMETADGLSEGPRSCSAVCKLVGWRTSAWIPAPTASSWTPLSRRPMTRG